MAFIDVYGVQQFRELVNDDALAVACFSAVWCGPCKTIERDLEKLAHEFPAVRFMKVDADNNTEIVTRCKILQLPTFLVMQKGVMLGYVIGTDLAMLKSLIRQHSGKKTA